MRYANLGNSQISSDNFLSSRLLLRDWVTADSSPAWRRTSVLVTLLSRVRVCPPHGGERRVVAPRLN